VPAFRFVTFLSDYGLQDGFVGVCRAAILEAAPDARVIDLTHLVPPQDVRRGAAVLATSVPDLPPAVHLAIVDPGVGGPRRAVAVLAGRSILVGPDNGLLPPAADALGGAVAAVTLTTGTWFRQPVSATFHGRDVFAPVAGRLAAGAPLQAAGEPLDPAALVRLPAPRHEVEDGKLTAEVIDVDGFGNAALAAGTAAAASAGLAPGVPVRVFAGGRGAGVEAAFCQTFSDVAAGQPLVYLDSAGRVAVAVRGGSAASVLGLAPGALVTVTRS
jgi:S-adenosylmethionine hydrolase